VEKSPGLFHTAITRKILGPFLNRLFCGTNSPPATPRADKLTNLRRKLGPDLLDSNVRRAIMRRRDLNRHFGGSGIHQLVFADLRSVNSCSLHHSPNGSPGVP
jgi:hypothetical protein